MPTYDYRCNSCQTVVEITHSIKDTPVIHCEICLRDGKQSPMERLISLNRGGFIMKQWTESMAWKTKRDKMKGGADLGVKQIERYGNGTSLQPNVAGMEVDSWSDAAKVAKEAGMRAETYEPLIEKEKRVSKSSGVDDTAWKAAKAEAGKI
jgi:putative FmdB family regulatory protein